jgi:hypothetical protein
MNAEQARKIATERRELDGEEGTDQLRKLRDIIDDAAIAERERIDQQITNGAGLKRLSCTSTFSVRISASRTPQEDIGFIEDVANLITESVVLGLKSDGFNVTTRSEEVVDYRDRHDAPPEYYDTNFYVNWQQDTTSL